jgi:hypothetical protein
MAANSEAAPQRTHLMSRPIRSIVMLAALSLAATAPDAGSAAAEIWSGVYQCSAMQTEAAASPAFTSSVRMVVEGTAASIVKESGEIKQTLSGDIKADGSLRLEGVGMRKDTTSPGWRYRFDGRFDGPRFQARGMMFSANLATRLRDCTMTLTRSQGAATTQKVEPPAEAATKGAPRASSQEEPKRVMQVLAGADPAERTLDFTSRNDSAVVEGTVGRAEPHRYIVSAKKGQALTATLKSNEGARFDLYEPGSTLAMLSGGFVVQGARVGGTPEGTQLDVDLPDDGQYLLLVRAPKDRTPYTLELAVSRGASSVGDKGGPWWSQRIVWIPAAAVLAVLVLWRLFRKRDRRLFRPD